jgi:hypothetical protein
VPQPFPDSVVKQAWDRSGGKCECKRTGHGHYGRCNKPLVWSKRGKEESGGWEAHHIDSNGPPTLSNCEILCIECHKKTGSYGS